MKEDLVKKYLIPLLVITVAMFAVVDAFAGGQKDAPAAEPTYELILVNTGFTPWDVVKHEFDTGGYPSFQHKIVAEFQQAHPNIKVNLIARDVTQGSLTVDALIAKGTPPDVWLDAAGNLLKYMNSYWALPMEQYMDVSVYEPEMLKAYTFDGHVYAIPMSGAATGMAVNLDMLKAIGYTLPAQKDWTTDEFLKLAEKLKAAGIPATMIMTQDGLITWNLVWLYAFGAELFKGGDYSKVAINTPEARKGLEYIKLLVDKGYSWPFPNEVDDDKGVELFTTGKVFSCMLQNGHADYWIPEQLKNGTLKQPFEYTFIEFPHAPGRAHTPVYGYQALVLSRRSTDEGRNKAVVELAKTQIGEEYQKYAAVLQGGMTTLKGYTPPKMGNVLKPSYGAVAALPATAGLMDLGSMNPRIRQVNAAWKIPMQEFMEGKITAQAVLDRFEAEANKILAAK